MLMHSIQKIALVLLMALISVMLLSPAVSADIVYYTDGGSLEGKVILESEAEVWIEVATASGKAVVKVPRSSVQQITRGATLADKIDAMYRDKEAAMNQGKAEDWYKLGVWCEQFTVLTQKARKAFETAIAVDPDYGPAHLKLGHIKYEGIWMSYEDMMLARGYVKYQGEWVTVEGKVELMLKDREIAIEREKRLAQAAAAEQASIEKRLAEKSAELEKERERAAASRNSEPSIYYSEYTSSPFSYIYPSRTYSFPGNYSPHPYYVRYPYRTGYHYPAPCSGVSVHYTKKSSHSSFRVGFVFR